MPFTILRPVLIYGSGVKGNLARLIELARKPWPLPFGLCRNRRSLLARQNLIDAIHFTLGDARDARARPTSSRTRMPLTLGRDRRGACAPAKAARRDCCRFLLPLIALGARAMGRGEEWQRLGGAQVADPSKLLNAGWKPAVGTRLGLAALVQDGVSRPPAA